MNLRREWRSLIVGGAVVLVLIVGTLLVQHLRDGWPFSAHHNVGTTPKTRQASHQQDAGVAPTAHPRAPVELDPSRLSAIGVRIEQVRRETISRPLRTIATVVPDESRISHVHTRVSGWICLLYTSDAADE